jgi:hypothetical protein
MKQIHQGHLVPGEVSLLRQNPFVPLQLVLKEGLELVDEVVVGRDPTAATLAAHCAIYREGCEGVFQS